tara:strand:+ start:6389 stop:7441 length:1053 start_codon:yes stop_codon:yes gene_type:complete
MQDLNTWLDQIVEETLEPELPIIDPHHHLWDRPNSPYLLKDIAEDVSTHNIRQTIFIECGEMYSDSDNVNMRVVGETEFASQIGKMSDKDSNITARIASGVVGTANLLLGEEVAQVLEAHIAANPDRFKGIRHRAVWLDEHTINQDKDILENSPTKHINTVDRTPKESMLLDETFRKGFSQLSKYDLTFEGWVYHPQLNELYDLAQAFPDTKIILNHLGGPLGTGIYRGKLDEIYPFWKKQIAKLAQCKNIYLKVGGIQMPLNGHDWHRRPVPPSSDELIAVNHDWYMYAIEQFGPERSMFESNFPVDKQSCSYNVVWNQFKKLSMKLSETERQFLFHDTAMNVYQLEKI